jgi:ribosomal-protein-alanine N-acetyltransferase
LTATGGDVSAAIVSGPVLTTARLRLRPATEADIDALHRLWTDPDVRRFLWDDVVIDREQAAAVVSASLDSFTRRNFGQWIVVRTASDELVGFCGLREVAGTTDVELLYGLAPTHWGQGLATEASTAVLAHAFDACALDEVIALADTPNEGSTRVMERLRMQPAPPYPDTLVRYAIRRAAFRA